MPGQRQHFPAQRNGRVVDSLQSLQQHLSRAAQVRSEEAPKRHCNDSAFTFSVTAALKNRRDGATPVIMAELNQMLDKHGYS
jgi:hypothetical protein